MFKNLIVMISLLAPLHSPVLVIAHKSSSSSLLVQWALIQEDDFRGQPISFNIIYYPAKVESDINFVSVNYTTNITMLTNLTVYTMYVINVSAVSSGGIGPVKTARARTGEEGMGVFKLRLLV